MPSMKVNGAKTRQMEEESSGMPMETSMRESGKTTKPMDTESTFMSTELNMKDTGRMIFKTAKEWSHGKMGVAMKVVTRRV
jgi:hypothetical protein